MLSFSARNTSSILCSNSLCLLFVARPNDPQFKADTITGKMIGKHATGHGGAVKNG
jgi:hypothetical protein